MEQKNTSARRLPGAVFALLLTTLLAGAYAAGTGSSDNWPGRKLQSDSESAGSLYDKGVAADKAGNNRAALKYFQRAFELDRQNPDILNMLAHSKLKAGLINEAITDYWAALKLRPRFPEAREYLGEAYIQAALMEIKTLKSYGEDGEEQREDLVKEFRDAAEGLEPVTGKKAAERGEN